MPGFEVIGDEEKKAVMEIFEKDNGVLFAHGFAGARNGVYRVRDFENKVKFFIGTKYAQAVSSGSAALYTALKAMGIKPGDEVITQSFTFVATVEAIIEVGAVPVICDIDETLNLDPDDFERKITPKTKLVIPVHMAGVCAKMDRIMEIANANNLPVLEDAAQAFGCTFQGHKVGTIGDAAIFSFDFGKTITCGEGGMIVTNNDDIFFEARCFHDHGHEYDMSVSRGIDPCHSHGFNFRMTEMQAAVASVQLQKLDFIVSQQRKNKAKLKEGLSKLPIRFRSLPDENGEIADTLFFFVENSKIAKKIVEKLNSDGLHTKNVPDALKWHFAGYWDHMIKQYYKQPLMDVFSKSWSILEKTVSLPIWVKDDNDWLDNYIKSVSGFFKGL